MSMRYSERRVKVKKAGHKGRGVFADRDFYKGETIEKCPVIVFEKTDWSHIEKTDIANYVFNWGNRRSAIALGYGSLYNHSAKPNAYVYTSIKERIVWYVALRAIHQGEEISIDYGYKPDGYDPKKD